MPFDVKLTITGIQEAQRANERMIHALRPTDAFGRAIKQASIDAHRYAQSLTHVDTGSLKSSHRMEVAGLRGMIYLDPGAANPRSGALTSVYGPAEHARGGDHAFYARVIDEYGDEIGRRASNLIRIALEKA